MMYFPIFVDLTEKNILVVGGGRIASRRIHSLLKFAGHITVIAPQISEDILRLAERKHPGSSVRILRRTYESGDLDGQDLVLAATDDLELNRRIWGECRRREIPVNVCSDQALCDFQFPSILVDGDVVIGLNSSGQDHRLVKKTRQRIGGILGVQAHCDAAEDR